MNPEEKAALELEKERAYVLEKVMDDMEEVMAKRIAEQEKRGTFASIFRKAMADIEATIVKHVGPISSE